MHPINTPPTPKRENKHRTLALIAATLFAALLVGSMVTLFTMARQGQITQTNNTSQTGGAQQATPTPLPPPTQNIYTADGDTFLKLDSTTHNILWKYQVASKNPDFPPFLNSPVIADGTVYINTTDGNIHALDSTTGKVRWIAKEGIDVGLVVADGLVFLRKMQTPGDGGPYTLFALNASNGKRHITYTLKDIQLNHEPFIIVENKVLYIGVGNHLLALNAQDGSEIWRTSIAEDEQIGPLTIEKGILHFSTVQSDVPPVGISVLTGNIKGLFEYGYAIDKPQQKWRHQLPLVDPSTMNVTPLMADGIQYYSYGNNNGRVFAWNTSQGATVWNYERQGALRNAMLVMNGVIYICDFTQPEKIVALNATTGKVLWEQTLGGWPGLVRSGDGKLFAIAHTNTNGGEATLYEFNIKDGSILWSRPLKSLNGIGIPLTIAP